MGLAALTHCLGEILRTFCHLAIFGLGGAQTIPGELFAGEAQLFDLPRVMHAPGGLFLLLDINETGRVSFEELLDGVLRLRGSAQAIDLATLMYCNKRSLLA